MHPALYLRIKRRWIPGLLEHQAIEIDGVFVWWVQVHLHGQSWKLKLQNNEITFRIACVELFIDFDEKLERPRSFGSVRGP